MTPQITIVLIIFLLFIALILSGKVKIHVAAMMIPIALEITGVLDFKAAWGGMLNSSIVMMAAMFVVGAAVGKTSIVSRLSKTLIRGESSDFKIMLGHFGSDHFTQLRGQRHRHYDHHDSHDRGYLCGAEAAAQ